MKKQLIIIGILFMAAAGVLMALNLASDAPNKGKNGFNRKFISDAIVSSEKAAYKNIFMTICGWDDKYIYYSCMVPGRIYRSGYDMKALDTLKLDLPEIHKLVPLFNTFVNYPDISITGGNARVVIIGDLRQNTYKAYNVDTLFSAGFTSGGSSFVMKTINKEKFYMAFVKYDTAQKHVSTILEPFGDLPDAFFNYDGKLIYDQLSGKYVYVTFYGNSIITFDTSLNVDYRARTIDTINNPLSSAAHLGNGITHGAPPVHVNNEITSDGKFIYVYANLQADNEQDDNAGYHIDLYQITDGQYSGSFYLPKHNADPLVALKHLKGNTLLALHKKQVIKYTLKDLAALSK